MLIIIIMPFLSVGTVVIHAVACVSVTELSLVDILTTPSLAKPSKLYSRTPGQVLSLICSLGFVSNA